MKQILIILFFLPLIIQAQKPILVPINAGTLVKRDTANGLAAQLPVTIVSGGSSHVDTVKCETCGTSAGTITGNGVFPRVPMWINSSRLSGGWNVNADTTNTRIGFGTTAPTHTITLDSTRAGVTGGLMMYQSVDQTTNYNRLHIYSGVAGHYILNEVGGTGNCCKNLYLNSTSALVTYNGGMTNTSMTSSGTVTGPNIIGAEMRWDNTRAAAGTNNTMRINNFTSYNASSGQVTGVFIGASVTQTSTAGFTALRIGTTNSTIGSGTYNLIEAGTHSNTSNSGTQTNVFTVSYAGKITLDATNTAAATTGDQTINKPSGSVNFAASATSLVVTNSLATTSSHIFLTVETNDASNFSVRAVPASGSFTIHIVGTAPAAETKVAFLVIN